MRPMKKAGRILFPPLKINASRASNGSANEASTATHFERSAFKTSVSLLSIGPTISEIAGGFRDGSTDMVNNPSRSIV